MKKANLELVMNVRRALEEIPVRTYEETNLKLGMMQALDQVIKEEDADYSDRGGPRGGQSPSPRERSAMQALDQVIRAEDADCDGGGARGGDEVPARESEAR